MEEIFKILLLILVANGAPMLISYLFSHRMSLPVDFGLRLKDQQPLFGVTKTWRGIIASIAATVAVSYLLYHEVAIGLFIALLAMCGDLFSSFIKRRLKKSSGSQMFLLDQLPESTFPALLLLYLHHIDLMQVISIVTGFIILELLLSILLFRVGIRKHPYQKSNLKRGEPLNSKWRSG